MEENDSMIDVDAIDDIAVVNLDDFKNFGDDFDKEEDNLPDPFTQDSQIPPWWSIDKQKVTKMFLRDMGVEVLDDDNDDDLDLDASDGNRRSPSGDPEHKVDQPGSVGKGHLIPSTRGRGGGHGGRSSSLRTSSVASSRISAGSTSTRNSGRELLSLEPVSKNRSQSFSRDRFSDSGGSLPPASSAPSRTLSRSSSQSSTLFSRSGTPSTSGFDIASYFRLQQENARLKQKELTQSMEVARLWGRNEQLE